MTNSPYDSLSAESLTTAPTLGQVLNSITAPPGFYKCDWTGSVGGTSTGTDSDNFALNVPGDSPVVELETQGTPAISALTQTSYAMLTAAANVVTVTAIVAGGASAVYHSKLVLTLWPRDAQARS